MQILPTFTWLSYAALLLYTTKYDVDILYRTVAILILLQTYKHSWTRIVSTCTYIYTLRRRY